MNARMNIFRTALASFFVVVLPAAAGAQWIDHPTPGIPRTADGKPNLTAPAPRTPDGKPDLSDLWNINGLGITTNITAVEMLPWAQQIYRQRQATYGHEDQQSARKVAPEVLARYAGVYEVEGLGLWTLSVEGDELLIELADGGGRQRTIALSDTVFVFPPFGGRVRFVTDGKGPATQFVLTVVEGDVKATRK